MLHSISALRAKVQHHVEKEGLRPFSRRIGLPLGVVRSIQDGRDVSVSNLIAACEVLGLEFYVGPKRDVAPASKTPPRTTPISDALFPPAEHIIAATCDADRAALILRLPDAIVCDHLDALRDACVSVGFTVGAAYLTARAASFSAVRRLDGSLALNVLSHVEDLRHAVMVIAFSEAVQPRKVSSPTGRTRHAKSAARPAASFPGGGHD